MSRQKTIKDTSWNIVDYISTLIIFLITTKILIKQIGTDGYGFYTFFTSLIGTFGLVDLGMGMAVSKYLSEFLHNQKFDEANQVITIAFIFYTVIGLSLFLYILYLISKIPIKNRGIKIAKVSILVIFTLGSFTDRLFYLNSTMSLFALICGLIFAQYRFENTHKVNNNAL